MKYSVNFTWDLDGSLNKKQKDEFLKIAEEYGEFHAHGIGFAHLYTNSDFSIEDNAYDFDFDNLLTFFKKIKNPKNKIRVTSFYRFDDEQSETEKEQGEGEGETEKEQDEEEEDEQLYWINDDNASAEEKKVIDLMKKKLFLK